MVELHQSCLDRQAPLLGPGAGFLSGFVPAIAAYFVAHEVEQLDVGAEHDGVDQRTDLNAQCFDTREVVPSGSRCATGARTRSRSGSAHELRGPAFR